MPNYGTHATCYPAMQEHHAAGDKPVFPLDRVPLFSLVRSLHRFGLMTILTAKKVIIIIKNASDTTRRIPARSSAIMMVRLLSS